MAALELGHLSLADALALTLLAAALGDERWPASTGCSLVGTFHRRVARHSDQRARARRCGGTAAVLGLAGPDCGLAAENPAAARLASRARLCSGVPGKPVIAKG